MVAFPKFARPMVRVMLWEERRRPVEEDLRDRLVADGYGVVRWSNEAATGYPPHAHIYPELLWLVSGSLTVILTAEKRLLEWLPAIASRCPRVGARDDGRIGWGSVSAGDALRTFLSCCRPSTR